LSELIPTPETGADNNADRTFPQARINPQLSDRRFRSRE